MQAAPCPTPTTTSGGAPSEHAPVARKHREAKLHPGGGANGLGTSPANTTGRTRTEGSGANSADNNTEV